MRNLMIYFPEDERRHYFESEDQIRIRTGRNADFKGGPLCGNGNFHARTVSKLKMVNCDECLKIISKNRSYYSE